MILAILVLPKHCNQKYIYLLPFVSHTGLKDVSSVNGDTSLGELGLDSLMGVEVKQTLERHHDVIMDMPDIRKLTFNKIKQVIIILFG